MRLPSWFADRRLAVAAIALGWLISRAAILISEGPGRSDIELYFRYAVQGVDQHQVPYRDFDVEYPPVAYWFMALPRWIDPHPMPPGVLATTPLRHSPDFLRYGYLYQAQVLVCDLASLLLVLSLRGATGRGNCWRWEPATSAPRRFSTPCCSCGWTSR